MSIADNAFNETLRREQAKQKAKAQKTAQPIAVDKRKTVWVVDESSRNYDWFVVAETEAGALRAFKAMWRDWCKATGADPYYWGSATDIWDGIQAREVKLGVPYMDREPFKCG